MKRMKNIFLAAVGLLLVSCAEPELIAPQNPESEQLGEPITITVGMPSNAAPGTKVSIFDPDNNKPFELKWEEGDQLIAVGFNDQNKYIGTSEFTIQSGFSNEKNAAFDGYTVPGAAQYDIYYKTPGLTVDKATGEVTMSYNTMESNTTMQLHHLFLKSTQRHPLSQNFTLKCQNSILCLNLTCYYNLGKLKSVDWITNVGTAEEHSLRLNYSGATSKSIETASTSVSKLYMCFDPAVMQLQSGQTMTFRVNGTAGRNFSFSTHAKQEITYTAGYLYDATIAKNMWAEPAADIFDGYFTEDRECHDLSTSNIGVVLRAGDATAVARPDGFNNYAAFFYHEYAKEPAAGTYTFPEHTFLQKMKSGYSLEAYVMCNVYPEQRSGESKAFSSTNAGGTALMISKEGFLSFLTCGKPSGQTPGKDWHFASSNIKPEVGRWYHMVGTWDKNEGMVKCYIDGELNGEKNVGNIDFFPSTLGNNAFWTIGANSWSGDYNVPKFNNAWNGAVTQPRIYSRALSAEKVKSLYLQLQNVNGAESASPVVKEPMPNILDVKFKKAAVAVSGLLDQCDCREGDQLVLNDGFATFSHPVGTDVKSGYIKIPYTLEEFKMLQDGHSMEVIFSADASLKDLPEGKEAKMFASHGSGGTGFLITKAKDGINGQPVLAFLPHVGGDYCWAKSNLTKTELAGSGYYHVVGVWDKKLGKAYIYVNGKLEGTVAASGRLGIPSNNSQWFGVGGDAAAVGAQSAWNGNVAVARIYDDPLTADQVTALYNKAETQKLVNPQK